MPRKLRTPDTPEGVRFPREGPFLASVVLLNLMTRAGDLDLSFVPAGTTGYGDLQRSAVPMTIKGVTIAVADLADIIRSKAAADRPKDRRALPVLHELLDVVRRQHGGS